nr:hypothetical protein [uncultured Campylobacter sp.]
MNRFARLFLLSVFYFPFASFIKFCGIETVNFRYTTSASDSVKHKTMPQNLAAIRHDMLA